MELIWYLVGLIMVGVAVAALTLVPPYAFLIIGVGIMLIPVLDKYVLLKGECHEIFCYIIGLVMASTGTGLLVGVPHALIVLGIGLMVLPVMINNYLLGNNMSTKRCPHCGGVI